jgi:alpha-galactosidase
MEVVLMIIVNDEVFRLDTANTSYIFRLTKFGQLEHVYYGSRLDENEEHFSITEKRTAYPAVSVIYDSSVPSFCLDNVSLEWSDNGRGDYRTGPTELIMPDGSFVSDFTYHSHEIVSGSLDMNTLPTAYGGDSSLVVVLKDRLFSVYIKLIYTVYESTDVITRRAVIENHEKRPIILRRFMSLCLDLPDEGFDMLTLDGSWIKEAKLHRRSVQYGTIINSSITGASSNRHNPGFILAAKNTTEDNGRVYGFNLVYSGNHCGSVEKNHRDSVRVMLGINPHCFQWELDSQEFFEAPEAVLSFSSDGLNGLSQNMHSFINKHIVRSDWKGRERPVLLNNWEGTFFDFNQTKLLELAAEAKELGVELFVLDDGWFGARNSDKAGLGDYTVNLKKLPEGMKGFAEKIRALGLDFGLWFEPEMVNPDSELYRAHPEYALTIPGREPVLSRNQLVLDILREEVRDYIVENVSRILDECNISYVKWDMNRHIAEAYSPTLKNQGEFYHRYIIALYDILNRIFRPRPHILLESCSSGGNRFDLGMLCFSPQIWCSDDTDPIERLKIQGGLSYLYPLSVMGAHVSQAPHQQTLRDTPLATRFHAACFGCLGYELDLKFLSPEEKKDIKEQIVFYKKYRRVFQYGTFTRVESIKDNKVVWQVSEGGIALTGFFQTLATAAETAVDRLTVKGLPKGRYRLYTRPQRLYAERFGELIKHVGSNYTLKDAEESYVCSSQALEAGIPLIDQFIGTGYNENLRMLGDFGSKMYITEKLNEG